MFVNSFHAFLSSLLNLSVKKNWLNTGLIITAIQWRRFVSIRNQIDVGGTSRTPSPSFLGCSILHRDFFAIAGCNLPRNYLESRNWSMAGRVCRGFAHSEKRNLCDFCLEFLLYVYMLGNVSALQIRRDLIGKLNPRWIYWIVLTRSLGLCGQTVELLRRNRLLRSQLTVRSFHIVIFSSSNALLTNQRLKNSQV